MRGGSPGINAGRGLKLRLLRQGVRLHLGSPGINAGRGLKHLVPFRFALLAAGSPGINAGRGLKLGVYPNSRASARRIARY